MLLANLQNGEGCFGGYVIVAIQLGEHLGPDAAIATLMVDSGLKYLSTDVFKS